MININFESTDHLIDFHSQLEKINKQLFWVILLYTFRLNFTIDGGARLDFTIIADIVFLSLLLILVKKEFFGKWLYVFIVVIFFNITSKVLALIGLSEYYLYLSLEQLGIVLIYFRYIHLHPGLKDLERMVTFALIFVIAEMILLYGAMLVTPIALWLNEITQAVGAAGIIGALLGFAFPTFIFWLLTVIYLFTIGYQVKKALEDFNPYDKSYVSKTNSLPDN